MPKGKTVSKNVAKIASWNVNGIRACSKAGLAEWMNSHAADVVMLQEVRADQSQVPEEISCLAHYHQHWFPSTVKKGYSGTAILSKSEPKKILNGMGHDEFDGEGRAIAAEFDSFIAVSSYFPNSQTFEGPRLAYKLRFCDAMAAWLKKLGKGGKPVVLGGDFNVAPYEIDLARPKDNTKTPGFLPEERAWMDAFLKSGWIDTWRHQHPEEAKYSWWSARTNARPRNIGWRIDFNVVAKAHVDRIASTDILTGVHGSDHCPVTLDLLLD